MDFELYYKKTYNAWLGKLVGIRLGAPIEGWEYDDILKTYGEINYYPVDYGVFGADDDSNGPRFFVEALMDDTSDNQSQNMANAVLNYIRNGHGFFWWGGVGISTEHTAYNNLINNVSYLESGKAHINGNELSQQIGGQIFSDCWGYVSMGNPELACKLAYNMASITHDKEALEGAKFIASAVSLAYINDDVYEVVRLAKTYIDNTSEYYRMIEDIESFYAKNKNYQECVRYIINNYSYAKYGGVCPIIPNAALIIMSLLYGENDFDKTMCILASAGWDTDCNLGNVGSIMGALKGVSEKWEKPINDLVIFSSSIGSLNIDTITNTAYRFVQIGYKLIGETIEDLHGDKFVFSTQAFNTRSNRYSESNLKVAGRLLKVIINNGYEGYSDEVYKKSFFMPDEIYDFRYEPALSPTVYPGETVIFSISNPEKLDIEFTIYVKDSEDNYYFGEIFSAGENFSSYKFQIPKGDFIVSEYGLKFKYLTKIIRSYFLIHEVKVSKDYEYEINFTKEKNYDYGLDFMSIRQHGISQIVNSYGSSVINNGLIVNDGMVIFSDIKSILENISIAIYNDYNLDFIICFNVKGINRYEGIKIKDSCLYYVKNINRKVSEEFIGKIEKGLGNIGDNFVLDINIRCNSITVSSESVDVFTFLLECNYGAVGIINNTRRDLKVLSCKLKAL